jgi:glycosyltransferase involved in cell wall biosynthesis
MKLLIVANCEAVPYTGSGYVISNFAEGLRRRGHRVDLFDPTRFEIMTWMRPRANNLRASLGMLRVIKDLDLTAYDGIEFWGAVCWRALRWVKRYGPNRLIAIHHSNGPEARYDQLYWSGKPPFRQQRWLVRARQSIAEADGVITVSRDDEQWLKHQRLNSDQRIVTIEPGLPTEFHKLPTNVKRQRIIGFCGNWIPRKGISRIVEHLPIVLRSRPDWRLQLIGVGTEFRREDVFPPDVLHQIDVIPFVYDKSALAQRYLSWEICIFPSEYESFGLVLTEAMACGCACIATEVGFSAGLRNNVEILHMDQNGQSLANKLNELTSNTRLCRTLGGAASLRVATLRWETSINRYEMTLQQWMDNRSEIGRGSA